MGPDASPSADQGLVLLATSAAAWEQDEDAEPLLAALERLGVEARPAVWDDPSMDWGAARLVVVRSTWDYPRRRDEFVRWAWRVGALSRLANPADVIEWNTDKRYLAEVTAADVPVVETEFLGPEARAGGRDLRLRTLADRYAEFVVKPSVSAGSKDTGRFLASEVDDATGLVTRICGEGRTAMVQPYLGSVDEVGETGLVYFEGRFSHAFNKAALLAPGGETDHGLFALERIDPATATPQQRDLGARMLELVAERFGIVPLYARVDLLEAGDGSPVLLELELTEPSWFLVSDPDAADRAAAAIGARLASRGTEGNDRW